MSNKLPALPPPLVAKRPDKKKKAVNRQMTASRFVVLNEFVDLSLGGLTRSDLIVWIVLYRDTRNGTAQTAQADIARRGSISKRAVQYAMQRLRKYGLLKCVYQGGLNRGPSRWEVLPSRTKMH